MSHECPICYQTCYCGGDIDDCCFSGTKAELMCDHCDEDQSDTWEDDDNYDDDSEAPE